MRSPEIYGPKFQEARLRVLERDSYKCRTCDHDGSESRLEVHHRHYRDGGSPNDDDLITLCVTCHDLITNKMRKDRLNCKKLLTSEPEETIIVSVERPKFSAKVKITLEDF